MFLFDGTCSKMQFRLSRSTRPNTHCKRKADAGIIELMTWPPQSADLSIIAKVRSQALPGHLLGLNKWVRSEIWYLDITHTILNMPN